MNKLYLGLNEITTGGSASPLIWSRPAEWLTLPSIAPSDAKFIGLLAVYNNASQYIALSASGNYTVDWGDGSTAENVASDVTAQHQYTFASISDSSDVHEADGITPKYRQVIVTVTMQAGQTFTGINLQKRHSTQSAAYTAPWLDIKLNGSMLDTIVISNTGQTVFLKQLEKVEIGVIRNNITSFANMFYNCHSLASISLFDTSASTNFQGMFQNCHSLLSIPLFNTGMGQTFQNFCYACHSLTTIPLLNTSAGTNFQAMFALCHSLKAIPAIITSQGTNFYGMFQQCYGLVTIPLLDTAKGTNFSYMFDLCTALIDLPLLNTSKATTLSAFLSGCKSLSHVPKFDTTLCTTFSSMFNGCLSLSNVPLLNTSNGTNLGYMFFNCDALSEVPAFNVAIANFSGTFEGCKSLTKSSTIGGTKAISYIYCRLARQEIIEIFNNLGTATGVTNAERTITLTSNPGVPSLTASDILIATNKNWILAL